MRTLKSASEIKVYGTAMSKQGAERLAEALTGAKVDHREGGFLGVGCQPHPLGCLVALVRPQTAAAKAGLTPGDVIIKYGGKATPDFERLTELISANRPGDTVALEYLRGSELLTREVTLGEWD
jgi:S1-C subfamily serine protease